MNRYPIIRQLLSLALMAVFALSITPKKTLHTWLADHTDQVPGKSSGHATTIGVAGYHCNIDNLVAESPFSLSATPLLSPVINRVISQYQQAETGFYSRHHFYAELRGPPAIG